MYKIKKKKILITGISGFVGASLARRFIKEGGEVHGTVSRSSDLWRLGSDKSAAILHSVDVTKLAEVESMVSQICPDIIFNCAVGRMSSFNSARDVNYANVVSVNITAVSNLLEATAKSNYDHFIHLGSSIEYGPRKFPRKESDLAEPNTFFGATKFAGTTLCAQFFKLTGKPITVLRPFSVYGYGEQSYHLIPTIVNNISKGIEIKLTEPGYCHDFVFIDDVVDACLLTTGNKNTVGEVINIATGVKTTNEEVVVLVEDLMGKKAKVLIGEYERHIHDSKQWVADIGKAKDILGWEAKYGLQDGVIKYIGQLV